MRTKRRIMAYFAVCVLLWPGFADAEWFGDAYLGLHSSKADDAVIKLNGSPVKRLDDSDTGAIVGGRIGYWFERIPWFGLAADMSIYGVSFDDIDIGVASISGLVMGRLQLNSSDDYPNGRIQPYAGVGPGIFYGGMSEFVPEIPPFGAVLDDSYAELGIDARAGVTVLIQENYGVFLEYGFKGFSPSFKSTAFGGGRISLDPTIHTHTLVLGMTFRW